LAAPQITVRTILVTSVNFAASDCVALHIIYAIRQAYKTHAPQTI